MKYKVLVTGKNTPAIDDFFTQMNDSFETMTTSSRYDDIIRHIKCFQPDVFVCCPNNETRETINQIKNAKYRFSDEDIPVVLFGKKQECEEFGKIAVNVADFSIYSPAAVTDIKAKLSQFLGSRKKKDKGKEKAPDDDGWAEILARGSGKGKEFAGNDDFLNELLGEIKGSGRKHILVVDDNSVMLKLIKEHLHEKYDVATAVSGKIALKFLERKKTDLILLDYEMPGENGPAVLEKLRASPETKDIPVVFLTGVTEREKIREALVLKPQSYLLKPINREKLLKTIEDLIG